MPLITIVGRDGQASSITVEDGLSVMEGIRDAGIDEMLALCGGCCSCATCHIYVADYVIGQFQPMSADEDDLLESASARRHNSRLACQLIVNQALTDAHFTIAPED